jgi:hypothetical protein
VTKLPIPPVKMTHEEAELLWANMTPKEKYQFSELFNKMQRGELMIKEVNVNEREEIKNIVLEKKEKPSIPTAPFAKHFKQIKDE